ncbi:MAG: tetratricopeptide repeat protein [Chloroflexi bacterium]|nr:MAG: tetratricopeptide repeat protein [Chloroflexota bacterium]
MPLYLKELIKAALAQNSGNQELQRVAVQLGMSSGQSSSDVPPATALPSIWNIPYPRNPFFTGQEVVLTQLATALKAGQAAALSQPQAITGLGGIGKTQIAIEFAYRHREEYQTVLWGFADTRESLVSGYLAIAHLLDLPQKDAKVERIITEAVKSWMQTHGSWLLTLDHADGAQSLGRFAKGIGVETMSQDVGALFLLRRAGLVGENDSLDAASSSNIATAKWICEELSGLPLALDQAGAYLEETQCGLVDYLGRYRTRRAALLLRRGGVIADHPDSVATTWSLSFERVEQQSPVAADLLRVCAHLSADAIPEEIVTQGATHLGPHLSKAGEDLLLLDEAIAVLGNYSLIRRDCKEETFSIHRLVQAVLTDAMLVETTKLWKKRVVQAMNAVFPDVASRKWEKCRRLLPHVLVCVTWIEQEQMTFPEVARLLTEVGSYLPLVARDVEAQLLLERALVIREQQLGREHPETIQSLKNLILLHYDAGDDDWAEPLLGRVLAIQDRQEEAEYPERASLLHDIACYCQTHKKITQIEPLIERVLAIWERLGPLHPHMASLLYNLADLSISQGMYDQARWLRKHALVIYVLPFRLRDFNRNDRGLT